MSNHMNSFEEIINQELENRRMVFCHGNSGCDSFCPVHHSIKHAEEFSYIDDKEVQDELTNLQSQCENCIIEKFIDFCGM